MRKYIIVMMLLLSTLFIGCADPVSDGAGFLEEGNYEEAKSAFETAIEKGKKLGEAYLGLGICCLENEDYESAQENFGLALENGAEESGVLYNLLGRCEMEMECPEKAVYYFAQGQVFQDVSDELKQEMAFNEIAAYEKLKMYDEAKAKLEIYVNTYPDDEAAAKELEFLNTQAPASE